MSALHGLRRAVVAAAFAGLATIPSITCAGWAEGDTAWQAGRYEEAMRHLLPLAQAGDAKAQYRVGTLLQDGDGIPQDLAQARHWFEQAARQGHAPSQSMLGDIHWYGTGVTPDPTAAVAWYRQAAELGYADGMARLGVALLEGKGVPADAGLGARWLQRAADAGSPYGQFRLAWAYLEGEGVEASGARACQLFHANAEGGFVAGMRELAARLEAGEGCDADPVQARRWFEAAARAGDTMAMYRLAGLHDTGRGGPVSKGHAVYWYVRAARDGRADARNDLGVMYLDGEFVARDPAIALALFSLAAADPEGQGARNRDKIAPTLDAKTRRHAETLARQMAEPAGFDAALDDSLAIAQGLPNGAAQQAAVGACLPPAPAFTKEQAQAWFVDAPDRGPLWRITKGSHSSYLYGTIHAGRAAWLMPGPRLLQVLRGDIDILGLEADLNAPETAAALAGMRQRMATLDQPALQPALDAALGPACTPLTREQKVPQLAQALMLSVREAALQHQHVDFGIEKMLTGLAQQQQLKIVPLESVDGAVERLLDPDLVKSGLVSTAERRAATLQRLSHDWEHGDMDDLSRYLEWCDCDDEASRSLMRRIVDQRNPEMANRLDALHDQGRRVLAAVGAMHMVGPNGLPALLAARGYRVERVPVERPAPAPLPEIRVNRAAALVVQH